MNLKAINKLPWPENLLRRLFMDEAYDEWKAQAPPDFDASFKFVLEETLTEPETYILYAFLRSDEIARNRRTLWNKGRQVCSYQRKGNSKD